MTEDDKQGTPQADGVFVRSIINQAQTMILNGVSREDVESALATEVSRQMADLKKDLLTSEQVHQIVRTVVSETLIQKPREPMAQDEVHALAQAITAKLGPRMSSTLDSLQPGTLPKSWKLDFEIQRGTFVKAISLADGDLLQLKTRIWVYCRGCGRTEFYGDDRIALFHALTRRHAISFAVRDPGGVAAFTSRYRAAHRAITGVDGEFLDIFRASQTGKYMLEFSGRDGATKGVVFECWVASETGESLDGKT